MSELTEEFDAGSLSVRISSSVDTGALNISPMERGLSFSPRLNVTFDPPPGTVEQVMSVGPYAEAIDTTNDGTFEIQDFLNP